MEPCKSCDRGHEAFCLSTTCKTVEKTSTNLDIKIEPWDLASVMLNIYPKYVFTK